MFEIDELHLEAVGRFVEKQVIEFKKLGNLVQVDGLRTDTGGSSGSGKTTLFNSLDYALGLNDIPSNILQSRFTKDAICVTVIGKTNGLPCTITRGKGKLQVEINGEITTGSKLAEEKIDQILGLPRNLFRPLLHKRQKEGGFFLQFTPKEIHDFLTDVLGLGALRDKNYLVDKKIKEFETELAIKANFLAQSRAALEATQNAVFALGTAPIQEIDQATIIKFKAAYDQSVSASLPFEKKQIAELAAWESTKPALRDTTADTTTLKALEYGAPAIERKIDAIVAANNLDNINERERVNSVIKSIQEKKVFLVTLGHAVTLAESAAAEAARIALEIKKIRESICPTCAQGWTKDAAKTREGELLGQLKTHGQAIVKGKEAQSQIVVLNQELTDIFPLAVEKPAPMPAEYSVLRIALEDQKKKISAERQRVRDWEQAEHYANRTILEDYNKQGRVLLEKHSYELAQINGQIDVTRRALDAAVFKFNSYKTAKERFDLSQKQMAEQLLKIEENINKYQKEVNAVNLKILVAEEIKRAIKGFTSCLFDEALEEIGSTATGIIRSIPNMSNATIQLEGTKETKEGKIKEEVNAVLSMDGETGIPIKSLSGGERSSVDLAVDLAVIDLLESRSNKGVDIFILDEPFTGLDTVSIEMAIDKLKALNKRLIIVDHNSEIKEMVQSKILVVRDGLTSKIVQN